MLDRTFAWAEAAWAALRDRDAGVTMPEYALMVVAVAIAALVGAALLGADLSAAFSNVGNTINP